MQERGYLNKVLRECVLHVHSINAAFIFTIIRAFLIIKQRFCVFCYTSCRSVFTQVVDHDGSAEEGADLIFFQLEKVIKQVQTISNISLFIDPVANVVCAWRFLSIPPACQWLELPLLLSPCRSCWDLKEQMLIPWTLGWRRVARRTRETYCGTCMMSRSRSSLTSRPVAAAAAAAPSWASRRWARCPLLLSSPDRVYQPNTVFINCKPVMYLVSLSVHRSFK